MMRFRTDLRVLTSAVSLQLLMASSCWCWPYWLGSGGKVRRTPPSGDRLNATVAWDSPSPGHSTSCLLHLQHGLIVWSQVDFLKCLFICIILLYIIFIAIFLTPLRNVKSHLSVTVSCKLNCQQTVFVFETDWTFLWIVCEDHHGTSNLFASLHSRDEPHMCWVSPMALRKLIHPTHYTFFLLLFCYKVPIPAVSAKNIFEKNVHSQVYTQQQCNTSMYISIVKCSWNL